MEQSFTTLPSKRAGTTNAMTKHLTTKQATYLVIQYTLSYTPIATNLYILIIIFKFPLPHDSISDFLYNILNHFLLYSRLILMP